MGTSSQRKAARLGKQASELMLAAPQVVAHRLGRMAVAGPRPSAKDQHEFHRMGAEKVAAFGEAWQAMTLQALKSNQQLAASMMRSWWPALTTRGSAKAAPLSQAAAAWQHAALDILGQGIRPVHRRAVANAKRLGRHGRR
ncbi:MAG: hypothetical protein KF720_09155 [Rubrivivax sp.]|nr:hypothetical protein [Rubrivivax sp.]